MSRTDGDRNRPGPASGEPARAAVLIDDIDGSQAIGRILFAPDGTDYEITLSAAHDQALREVLDPYVDAARRTRHRRPGPPAVPSPSRNEAAPRRTSAGGQYGSPD